MIHSGNVISVYNPLTGHTTPQFHIVFDDLFQTIAPNLSSSTSAEIDQLFDTLWQYSQWGCYNGNIPPNTFSLKTWTFLKMTTHPQSCSRGRVGLDGTDGAMEDSHKLLEGLNLAIA